jgi:hypothetical protein
VTTARFSLLKTRHGVMAQRKRLLLWLARVLWCLSLVACPIALGVVAEKYSLPVPAYAGPRPWAAGLVEAIFQAHLWISAAAMVVVPWLARSWPWRLALWVTVAALLWLTRLLALGAGMATTGVPL